MSAPGSPSRREASWTEVWFGAGVVVAALMAGGVDIGNYVWGIAAAILAAGVVLRALASPQTRDLAFAMLLLWSVILMAAAIGTWCARLER